MSVLIQNTTEFAQVVYELLIKLFKLQIIAQPAFLLEAVSACFRVALIALLLFVFVLILASLASLLIRKWGHATISCTVLVLCVIGLAWVMRPMSLITDVAAVESISVQTIKKGELSKAKTLIGKTRTAVLRELPTTKSVRTPLFSLPPMADGDKIYTLVTQDGEVKIAVIGARAWRYITEKTDFICVFENSDAFLKAIV